LFNFVGTIILSICLLFSFYPLIWMLLNSFKTNDEIFLSPMGLPSSFDLSVYAVAWERANFSSAFLSSIINSAASVALVLITGTLAAFALARIKFRGNALIVKLLTISIIISGQLILIPLFYTMQRLHLYNSLWATIFANTAMSLPLCIYLLYSFFREIPFEIEESTWIDGCGTFKFYYKFVLPLSKPILSTVIIFVSLWTWNEYLFALTFLKVESIRTIPLQLQSFFSRYSVEYDKLFAALSISLLPILTVYIILQKAFIKGLTAGAVKM